MLFVLTVALCVLSRFVSSLYVLLCGLCVTLVTVYSESLTYVVLLGFDSCVVCSLCCCYKVGNDLLCLCCESVCILFRYAVCAVCFGLCSL